MRPAHDSTTVANGASIRWSSEYGYIHAERLKYSRLVARMHMAVVV